MKFPKSIFLVSVTLIIFQYSFAQFNKGGLPLSYTQSNLKQEVQKIDLMAFKPMNLNDGKLHTDQVATPREIGFSIQVNYSVQNSGVWTELKDGKRIWRLHIQSKNAEALAVYFKEFQLSDHSELFLYKPDYSQVLGAYTSENNSDTKLFATELIEGDEFVIEYVVKGTTETKIPFIIDEVAYIYRDAGFGAKNLKGFGGADDCEININCAEGEDWQSQKRGVARIQVKKNGSLFWCTGSLINNANQDFTPYFLTANHCGSNSSVADYNQWIFYFNYESENCDNPVFSPLANTMLGASLKANTNFTYESDFKLLLLNDDVPEDFNPYYNGWDNRNLASSSGVAIHHPEGDLKKISTYTSPLLSTAYDDVSANPDAKYWQVIWGTTVNGQGVTEGGSSGSPLFNSNGLIVGALTGGQASCSNQDDPDYFGKISYSWESTGSESNVQLKAWLDPNDSGITIINGLGFTEEPFISNFKAADTTAVPVELNLDFSDLSVGEPTEWKWTFEGGVPNESDDQNPTGITYNEIGFYDVKLVIRKGIRSDSLILDNYVKVVPIVGPNPASVKVNIYLGITPLNNVELTLFDESGRIVDKYISTRPIRSIPFYVDRFTSGFYFLQIKTENYIEMHKLAIF